MKLATDRFFEQLRTELAHVAVMKLGHDAQMFVQRRVDFTTKILAAQAHVSAPDKAEAPAVLDCRSPDLLSLTRRSLHGRNAAGTAVRSHSTDAHRTLLVRSGTDKHCARRSGVGKLHGISRFSDPRPSRDRPPGTLQAGSAPFQADSKRVSDPPLATCLQMIRSTAAWTCSSARARSARRERSEVMRRPGRLSDWRLAPPSGADRAQIRPAAIGSALPGRQSSLPRVRSARAERGDAISIPPRRAAVSRFRLRIASRWPRGRPESQKLVRSGKGS